MLPLFSRDCHRNLEDFVFSHFPLINLRIRALKMAVEESRCSRKDKTLFWEDINNAKDKLASELRTLYSARRIQVSCMCDLHNKFMYQELLSAQWPAKESRFIFYYRAAQATCLFNIMQLLFIVGMLLYEIHCVLVQTCVINCPYLVS